MMLLAYADGYMVLILAQFMFDQWIAEKLTVYRQRRSMVVIYVWHIKMKLFKFTSTIWSHSLEHQKKNLGYIGLVKPW